MRIQLPLAVLFAAVFACSMHASPAQAQRVFVSAAGSDGNPCSFASPCRSFQHAHDVAPAGGEIDVLDPAGYGAVTITKAISIQGHGFSGISVPSGANGITINAATADKINLNGLLIDGAGVGQTGILLNQAGSLVIENCVVRNLTASGIALQPNATAQIMVSDTVVSDNGGHGIYIQPSGNLSYTAAFNRVQVLHNAARGIGIFGNFGTPSISAIVVDSISANNQTGFYAIANSSDIVHLYVFRSTAFQNLVGARAESGGVISVSQSNLEANGTSWSIDSVASVVESYGDSYTRSIPPPSGTFSKQ